MNWVSKKVSLETDIEIKVLVSISIKYFSQNSALHGQGTLSGLADFSTSTVFTDSGFSSGAGEGVVILPVYIH